MDNGATPVQQSTEEVSMTHQFQTVDASRDDILIRLGLSGPAGSGKTWTALLIGMILAELLDLGPVYLIDSENRSSKKYAYSKVTGRGFHFKQVFLPSNDYSPQTYMDALDHCESQGAKIIIIDSLSHAWNGTNGILEQVDKITMRSKSKNAFTEGWREMTPIQNKFMQRILRSPAHILLTLRSKVDWVVGDTEHGKKAPQKVGLAPVQREGVDYEPDLMLDLAAPENRATVSKTRCDRIGPGEVFEKPGWELALRLAEWIIDDDVPRTLDAALTGAIRKGVEAGGHGDQGRREYAAARDQLAAWCRAFRWSSGIFRDQPVDDIVGKLKSDVVTKLRMNGATPVGDAGAHQAVSHGHAA
jgi:hypothetical protein